MLCSHLYLPQSSALREDTFLIFLVQGREESCRGLGQEEYDELEERMKRDLKYNFVKSILSMVSDTKKDTGVSYFEITLNCEFTLNYMNYIF